MPRTLLVLLAVLEGVLAALYPTWPVSYTIYCAGRREKVTWIDDWHKPHLEQLGPLDIELHTADGNFVATLLTGVEPRNRGSMVDIPSELPSGSHNYTLYFIPTKPHETTYTADFLISKEDFSTPVLAHIPTAPVISSASNNVAHKLLTLVLPNTTITSQIVVPTGSETPGVTIYAEPIRKGDQTNSDRSRTASSGAVPSSRPSLEKVKFQFVFILWPALVGIAMAL